MSKPIHIIPSQVTEQLKSLSQSERTDDAFMDSMQYAFNSPDNLKIDGKSILKTTTTEIKPISIDKLSEQYHQSLIETVMTRLKNHIDEEFLKVLKRKGITEEQWKERGTYTVQKHLYSYCYMGECIFKVSYPEFELKPDSDKGELSVYYWGEGVD